MSDTQAYEEVTVASDGVTVTKRFEADEFPVPAIAFNFESRRNEAVTVHLVDVVPEGVAVEDLGFHPEYGSEFWTIDEEEISFSKEIEPGSEYTTVYGIRATGTDNVEQFLTEPRMESVDPPLEDDEEALVGQGSNAVKDVISGDADSVPGLDDDDDEDIETLDLKDPNSNGTSSSASSGDSSSDNGDDDDDGGSADASVALDADNVVSAMADELRNNQVAKDDVKLLRKAFDLASQDDGSVVARVQKLQQDVSDVIAYTDALEEFLDENGTGEQLVEEFQSQIDEFRGEIDEFQSELADIESTVSDNDDELADLSEDFAEVEDTVSTVEGTVEDVEGTVSTVESSVEDVEGTVGDLEDRLDDLNGEIEDLNEKVGNEDIQSEIQEINEEIEELKQWREQLSSVIGGGE